MFETSGGMSLAASSRSSSSTPGYQRRFGAMTTCGSRGKSGCRGMSGNPHSDNLGGVVTKHVDDLHRDPVGAGRRVSVDRRSQFQIAILPSPEGLPLVLEHVAAGPLLL